MAKQGLGIGGAIVDEAAGQEARIATARRQATKAAMKQLRSLDGAGPTVERILRGEVVIERDAVFDEAARRGADGEVVKAPMKRSGARAVLPLERYWTRGQITEAEYSAGNALRKLMSLSDVVPKMTLVPAAGGKGSVDDFQARRADAMASLAKARVTVGRQAFELLVHVLHQDGDAGTWPGVAVYQGSRRSLMAMKLLREALGKLAGKSGA